MSLSDDEKKELEQLRRYKKTHEQKALTRAFGRLENLLDMSHDPLISVRAFRTIAECLICLRDELMED